MSWEEKSMSGDKVKAACLRKKLYISHEEADRALLLCRKHEPTLKLRIYNCPQCKGWHLTSKPFMRFQPVKIIW